MVKDKIKKFGDALIFIDTNIYLDFYRAEKSFETSMVKRIKENNHLIITTDQVWMEYKKNRQKIIIKCLDSIKDPNINIQYPAFTSDTKQIKLIQKNKEEIKKHIKTLRSEIVDVLKNPIKRDPLYQCLQKIFQDDREYHLGRNNELRLKIRDLAKKRFFLGYPPRKDADLSFGDAINWEWIIHCAEKSKKNIIVVSRDHDYGELYAEEPILNDWLNHEFKDRTDKNRGIILTNRLSHALKLINAPVSPKEEKQEKELISSIWKNEKNRDHDKFVIFANEFAKDPLFSKLPLWIKNKTI